MKPDVARDVRGPVARGVFPKPPAEDAAPDLRVDDELSDIVDGRQLEAVFGSLRGLGGSVSHG